jgi:hypothetical protein
MFRRLGNAFGAVTGGASSIKPKNLDVSSYVGSYRPRSSSISGSADSGATGLARNADSGATGLARNADSGATGLARNADSGATGLARSADSGATGLARNADSGATGLARNADSGATGLARNADTVTDNALDVGRRTNPTVLRKMGKACKQNPGKCAAAGAGVGLAAYAADTFFENSEEQRKCITQCLPVNWDRHQNEGEAPEYHTSNDDSESPRCTEGDCDTYCQARCEALHPTSPGGVLGETIKGVTGAILSTTGGFVYDLLSGLGLPMDTILTVIEMVPYVLGLITVFWAYTMIMRVKRMVLPSAKKGGPVNVNLKMQQVPMATPVYNMQQQVPMATPVSYGVPSQVPMATPVAM